MRIKHWCYVPTVETVDDEELWAIREVYFDAQGKALGWTADPVDVVSESKDGLRRTLQNMLRDLDREAPLHIATCPQCGNHRTIGDNHSCA